MSDLRNLFKPYRLTAAALDEIEKRVRPTICTTHSVGVTISCRVEGRILEDDYDTLMAAARQLSAGKP